MLAPVCGVIALQAGKAASNSQDSQQRESARRPGTHAAAGGDRYPGQVVVGQPGCLDLCATPDGVAWTKRRFSTPPSAQLIRIVAGNAEAHLGPSSISVQPRWPAPVRQKPVCPRWSP